LKLQDDRYSINNSEIDINLIENELLRAHSASENNNSDHPGIKLMEMQKVNDEIEMPRFKAAK
tara:strand:+ start:132 stop:320 length:189 start_codon:yes stop_codon:yes gene_type:complete